MAVAYFVLNETHMDQQTQTQLEAAAFRRLVKHLDTRKDVQNIDLMILAGFCRNCLSKWLMAAAEENNVPMDYDQAREHVYCMPYEQWKNTHQLPATDAQVSAFSAIEKAKKLAKI
ncbi:DUF1244 domain-containing protein [Oceanospirillaceae bacterium]|jgi:hypothetical protein|uniref:DUF1244 domain-containing protein n=2 Tax=Candidatus Njordibacter sp. Uisw_002 TaxID=3230971 RepID=UPI00297A1FE0|nr:DUF1244 domain-containing protein [Oceanospirillaceae bacterium]MDC1509383.1 DUF1244 domain-containing protein [Oceanospirillaceae bacterium]|tara:strand:- start:2485 stop:2832 length:348 start_codon:yes stop_codon:yes gene_type:complete